MQPPAWIEPARSAVASEAGSEQPPAGSSPLHRHTGRPAAAGRARPIRCQQCNRPADAGVDRARSIGIVVDLQPLAWIESTRSAASEAVDLQPPAWTKPPRPKVASDTCSRWSSPHDSLPAVQSPCRRRNGSSPLHRHTGRPAAACMDRIHTMRCQHSGRLAATAVDLQPPAWTKPTRSAAGRALDLQPHAWTKPGSR